MSSDDGQKTVRFTKSPHAPDLPVPDINFEEFVKGEDRYIKFAEQVLGEKPTHQQREILRAVASNQRVVVMCANAIGKSYVVAMLKLAFLFSSIDSTVLGTSGSYSQYVDGVWRPLDAMHEKAQQRHGLPGEILSAQQQPRLEVSKNWYAKVISPRDPGDLEGRHGADVLVIIEEADKEYIKREHFDSAGSSISGPSDRMIAVCNPPKDEVNSVYEKIQSDRWEVVQLSALESHNVKVAAGEIDEEIIPGIIELETVIDDWEEWNNEPWPGLDEARMMSAPFVDSNGEPVITSVEKPGLEENDRFREDLDQRWYRRRAAIIPPDSSHKYRPFTVDLVERSYEPHRPSDAKNPAAVAFDVARKGGDTNVIAELFSDRIEIKAVWSGVDHNRSEERYIEPHLPRWVGIRMAIDAAGEGSGIADRTTKLRRSNETIRWSANKNAVDEDMFKNYWTEGLYHLGQFLKEGGIIRDEELRDQLFAAARIVEFEEKYYANRENDVLVATPKEDIKDEYGKSPDHLDAAVMAAWAHSVDMTANQTGFIISR